MLRRCARRTPGAHETDQRQPGKVGKFGNVGKFGRVGGVGRLGTVGETLGKVGGVGTVGTVGKFGKAGRLGPDGNVGVTMRLGTLKPSREDRKEDCAFAGAATPIAAHPTTAATKIFARIVVLLNCS